MNPLSTDSHHRLDQISHYITQLNRRLCLGISVASLLMVVLTFLIVVLRYGAGMGWIAMQESVMYLHAALFMIGIAYTLACDGHVRVDVFYRGMAMRQKVWVDMLGTIFLLMPVCVFIIVYSVPYVSESWQLLESSQEAGGLPLVFLLKSLIPVFAILLLLQGVSILLTCFLHLKTNTQQ